MSPASDLFTTDAAPLIVDDDGLSLMLWRHFVPAGECAAMMSGLLSETPWQQTELTMYGRRVKMPRLTCWYGDPEAVYTYSGLRNVPLPWTARLGALRERAQCVTGAEFNSVLLNLYRDGHDSMSWHSDDEPELGSAPIIASMSFGASRRFDFRWSNATERVKHPTRSVELTDGSLLLMSGDTQHRWQHGVAKALRVREPRINLTFRRIYPEQLGPLATSRTAL